MGASTDAEAEPHCRYQRAWRASWQFNCPKQRHRPRPCSSHLGIVLPPSVLELQGKLQNDQFAAHPPISPVLHWFDRGDVTAMVIKERTHLFPTSTPLSHLNTHTTVAHPPNRPCVSLLAKQITSWPWHATHLKSSQVTFHMALPPLKDRG